MARNEKSIARRKLERPQTWRLNNLLLINQWVPEEIKGEVKKKPTNENRNKT